MSLHGMVLNQAQEQLYNNNKMESSLLQGWGVQLGPLVGEMFIAGDFKPLPSCHSIPDLTVIPHQNIAFLEKPNHFPTVHATRRFIIVFIILQMCRIRGLRTTYWKSNPLSKLLV
jgi:hypothetical protein